MAFRSKPFPQILPKSYRHNAVPNRFSSRFSTSRTNGPRSLSRLKAGTHSAFGEGSHTAAYTAKQVAFRMGVVSLLSERSARSPTSPGRVSERQVLPLLGLGRGCSQRTQKAFGTAMRLCASLFRGVAAPLGCVICLQLGDVAVFFTLCAVLSERARWGWYHYPRSVSHGSETLRGRGLKRQTLPLLGLGRGCSRRTQKAFGTAMRLCASLFRRRRGPAGLRDLFRFCRNYGLYALRSGPFRVCEGWYHYPQRALRVAETLDGRLSKGFICRFLRLGSLH